MEETVEPVELLRSDLLSDEELLRELAEFDEHGFRHLPAYLKQELRIRRLPIPSRPPTELEMFESEFDRREHVAINRNDRTFEDCIRSMKR